MPKILIADDEDSMRTLVARAIAMDGHETVTAQDGAEALEILTREDGAFDLLLTDIQMPIMDGIALALSPARARIEPQCAGARRRDKTILGRGYPHRGGGRAGGEEGVARRPPRIPLSCPGLTGASSTSRPLG